MSEEPVIYNRQAPTLTGKMLLRKYLFEVRTKIKNNEEQVKKLNEEFIYLFKEERILKDLIEKTTC